MPRGIRAVDDQLRGGSAGRESESVNREGRRRRVDDCGVGRPPHGDVPEQGTRRVEHAEAIEHAIQARVGDTRGSADALNTDTSTDDHGALRGTLTAFLKRDNPHGVVEEQRVADGQGAAWCACECR